ncbi:MAG TPA: hypothetical protein VN132_03660 [Bdellovibrio sp.]|nr:hypothetical protein [Bdellovibrio sp.]
MSKIILTAIIFISSSVMAQYYDRTDEQNKMRSPSQQKQQVHDKDRQAQADDDKTGLDAEDYSKKTTTKKMKSSGPSTNKGSDSDYKSDY